LKSTKKIKIIPQGVTVEIDPGKDLFQALTVSGIYIVAYCGGQGICGKCRVRLHGNAPTPSELDYTHLSSEELDEGIRIACGLYPEDGDVVEVPVPASASTYKLEIEDIAFPVDPWQTVSSKGAVLAVDMGTTNMVGHLLDSANGRVIASSNIVNAQTAYGADVMTRLAYCSRLGAEIVSSFAEMSLLDIERLAASTAKSGESITDVVAVMNTAMETFLLGLDPDKLGRYPYDAEIRGSVDVSPFKDGPLAKTVLHIPPIIGGYVGSDTVAALLSVLELGHKPPYLVLDIGTNVEIVLVEKDSIIACSAPAGPAFEGAGISHGMGGVEGAIEIVKLVEGAFEVSVIGDIPAFGITGSGLFSLIGEMLRAEAMDRFGVMIPNKLRSGLVLRGKSGHEVALSPGVTVNEMDVQQFILSRAATRAAVETLLAHKNLRHDTLTAVFLCGTFANKISPYDIISIGLLPTMEPKKIRTAGNAAAMGALMMASSRAAFQEACSLAERVEHLTLSGNREFIENYQSQVNLGQPDVNR
jgi:uncharacterized 2Fe-2S/4Fe-4S cluster protein (DUF4445 family)